MGKRRCIYTITCPLTSINCVCALSACRNVAPKLREMFNEESSSDDMVCVKSVRNDPNWRVRTGETDYEMNEGAGTSQAAQGAH